MTKSRTDERATCRIRQLMIYGFKLGHDAAEVTKNLFCVKGERADYHWTVTKWFMKFCLGCKDLDNQARSARPKTEDSETMLQDIDANQVSRTQRAGHL